MSTVNQITEELGKTSNAPPHLDNDEDRYFCLSLVGQLREVEPRYKSMATLQIMKIFNVMIFSG